MVFIGGFFIFLFLEFLTVYCDILYREGGFPEHTNHFLYALKYWWKVSGLFGRKDDGGWSR